MYNNLKLLVPPQVYSMYLSVTICMCVCSGRELFW